MFRVAYEFHPCFFCRQGLDSGSNDLIVKPFEAEVLKEKAGYGRDFVAFFNLETLKPDRGLSAVTCQLKTCCKFNAQVSNRFVWEIPVIRGHW